MRKKQLLDVEGVTLVVFTEGLKFQLAYGEPNHGDI
jgi:hypothetical protein